MKQKMIFAVCAAMFSVSAIAQNPLDQIKNMAKEESKVQITLKEKITPGTAKKAPYHVDSYSVKLPGNNLQLIYQYFDNTAPEYAKTSALHPSSGGIGFNGKSWSFWYYGGMMRLFVNKVDITTFTPAKVTYSGEKNGNIQFIWSWGKKSKFIIQFIFPPDGNRIYARFIPEMAPEDGKINEIELRLTCYPGGFDPAYKLPSNRFAVLSDGQTVEIPVKSRELKEFSLNEKVKWAFLGDKLKKKGSIALLMESNRKDSSRLMVGSYGSTFHLKYGSVKSFTLGFYAFETINERSLADFKARAEADFKEMTTIKYGE